MREVTCACSHCGYSFDRRIALVSDTPGSVHCPRCQAVVVSDGAGSSAVCFECGVDIPRGSNDLVPICDSCAPSQKKNEATGSGEPEPPIGTPPSVLTDFPVAPDPEEFRAAGSLAYDESLELALRTSDSLVGLDVSGLSKAVSSGRARKEEGRESGLSLGLPAEEEGPLHLSAKNPAEQGQELGLSLRSDTKIPALTSSLRGSGSQSAVPHPARAAAIDSLGVRPSRLTSSPDSPPPEVIQFKRKTPLRDFFRGASRLLLILFVLASAAAGVWYATDQRFLVLPEDRLEEFLGYVTAWSKEAPELAQEAPLYVDDFSLLLERLETEHSDFLAEMSPEQTAQELYWRGRSSAVKYDGAELEEAKVLLERAVVLEPRSTLAVAGLAEVYARIGTFDSSRSELLVAVSWLLRRADELGGYPLERSRARVTWLLGAENFVEAESLAREALQADPQDGHFYFLLGTAQAPNEKAPEEAIQSFRRALEIEPDMERVWLEIGRLEESRKRYRPAAVAYREELALGTASSEAHVQVGHLMEKVGEFELAADHYRRSVILDGTQATAAIRQAVIAYQVQERPQHARGLLRRILAGENGELGLEQNQEVRVHLAAAMRASGDVQSSIRTAEELLEEEPSYSPALFQLGLSLSAAGRFDDAEGALLRLDSSGFTSVERAHVHFHAGRAALQRERRQDAVAAFNRAIDARPDFVPAYFWLIAAGVGRGGEESVIESSLRFVGRDPLEWRRPRDLGLVYGPVPSFDEVAQTISDSVPAEQRGVNARLALAFIDFYEGRMAQAETFLVDFVRRTPQHEGAISFLGLLMLGKSRDKLAVTFFEDVLRRSHNNGVYHAYLGEALRRSGRSEEALASLERAKAYGGELSWVETRVGLLHAELGDVTEAIASLERAEEQSPEALGPRLQRYQLGL
jgi:tetratricopeptide (TPR) repeat protein